jgi:hypothetical protein
MFAGISRRRRSAVTTGISQAESLESRALLTATATATLQSGTLTITGTGGADNVAVSENGGTLFVYSGRAQIGVFNSAEVNTVNANLQGGNDQFRLYTVRKQYADVNVNMGGGTSERVNIEASSIKSLKIDVRESFSTSVTLNNTAIPNCDVNFGSDQGRDRLMINTCDVDRLFARMGGGDDSCELTGTSYARNCDVDLGTGNDRFWVKRSAAAKGRISGGSGTDEITAPAGIRSDVRLSGFERLTWL